MELRKALLTFGSLGVALRAATYLLAASYVASPAPPSAVGPAVLGNPIENSGPRASGT